MKESYLLIFIVFISLLFLFACGNKVHEVAQVSRDFKLLGGFLDLETFKPDSVVFVLSEKDSPGNGSGKLEAVLFYQELVYGKILEKYMDEDFPKGDYKKEEFDFKWLDEHLKAELELSKADYKGNPDVFLGTDGKARLWFLDEKVFVNWER